METTGNKYDSAKETSRIESFSDGVFAIAITLLILDIHVPEVKANESLLKSLAHEWASFLALLIGFFTLLICWINHQYMFQMIHRSNSMLLLLNGFKLLVVTLTPFATALLSKHIQTDWKETAVNIYCFNFALMGIAMTAIWTYAYKKGFARSSSPKVLEATTRLYIFAGIFSTTIWIVSFFSIMACLFLSAIMFIIFLFPKQTVIWMVNRNKQ
jgi:uncharacterized membrane protein